MKSNVVIIIADQLNYRHTGFGGHAVVKTPNIDRIAQEGVAFTSAYCQSPLCMPSRSSFNTGLYPHTCAVYSNKGALPEYCPTIAQRLLDAGYSTGGFGHIGGDGVERGFEIKLDLDQSPLKEAWAKEQEYVLKGGGKPAWFSGVFPFDSTETFDYKTTCAAVEFIRDAQKPFFAEVNFYKPHMPHVVTEEYANMYNPDEIKLPSNYYDELKDKPSNISATRKATGMSSASEEDVKKALACYYGAISFVDKLTGDILEALEKKGILDETLVIFMADHGDYSCEFGVLGKTAQYYDCLTRVPLYIRCPQIGIKDGSIVQEDVQLIDIAPTVMKFAGVGGIEALPGRELISAALGEEIEQRLVFSEVGDSAGLTFDYEYPEERLVPYVTDPYSSGTVSYTLRGVMLKKGRYKYTFYNDGSSELYDLQNDPQEGKNLAQKAEYSELCANMTKELLKWQIQTWPIQKPQQGLPYHYRATWIEAVPDIFKKARKEWDDMSDLKK